MSGSCERISQPDEAMKADSAKGTESLRVRVRHAVKQVESRMIREALDQNHWNRRRTAEALKISYRSLMYKMKACQLGNTGQPEEN